MTDAPMPKIGSVAWLDLTVTNAEEIKDFYCQVVGWEATPHDMGDYHDFDIQTPSDGETITGICHAHSSNAQNPPQWLIYVTVANVEQSVQQCLNLGGKVIDGPRQMGANHFCVIQDPAGAVLALID